METDFSVLLRPPSGKRRVAHSLYCCVALHVGLKEHPPPILSKRSSKKRLTCQQGRALICHRLASPGDTLNPPEQAASPEPHATGHIEHFIHGITRFSCLSNCTAYFALQHKLAGGQRKNYPLRLRLPNRSRLNAGLSAGLSYHKMVKLISLSCFQRQYF